MSPTERAQHLRDAREILGPAASAAEVLFAAEFIRGGIQREIWPAIQAVGVARAEHPAEDDAEPQGDVVTGTPASVEFGFAPDPESYWGEDRQPARRRGGPDVR